MFVFVLLFEVFDVFLDLFERVDLFGLDNLLRLNRLLLLLLFLLLLWLLVLLSALLLLVLLLSSLTTLVELGLSVLILLLLFWSSLLLVSSVLLLLLLSSVLVALRLDSVVVVVVSSLLILLLSGLGAFALLLVVRLVLSGELSRGSVLLVLVSLSLELLELLELLVRLVRSHGRYMRSSWKVWESLWHLEAHERERRVVYERQSLLYTDRGLLLRSSLGEVFLLSFLQPCLVSLFGETAANGVSDSAFFAEQI